MDEKLKTRAKAYATAVHTMTTTVLEIAIKETELELAAVRKSAEHLDATLSGYKQARKERK